jgi:hypothetical protein
MAVFSSLTYKAGFSPQLPMQNVIQNLNNKKLLDEAIAVLSNNCETGQGEGEQVRREGVETVRQNLGMKTGRTGHVQM